MTYSTPKSRFQESDAANAHAALVKNPALISYLDIALLQMQQQRVVAFDLGTASSNWLKLEGAREFIKIFLMLSDKQDPPKDIGDVDNLKH